MTGGFLSVDELARRADFMLGAASVSPSMRTIRGPAGEVSLEPRAMQVLLTLADAHESVVTRADLFSRCWGNAAVGDDSLNRAIADVRRAARTAAGDSFTIETVPRTGYRLVAEPAQGDAPREDVTPSAPSRRWLMVAAPAMGVAAVAGAALWRWRASDAEAQADALLAQADQAMRTDTPEGYGRATALLRQATAAAPRDAAAWGKLALAGVYLAEVSPPDQAAAVVGAAQEAARRALALESRQADALGALAILLPHYGDWLTAERRMDAVLAVAPGHLPTLDARAFLYVSVGLTRKGCAERVAFTPTSPPNAELQYRLVYVYWMLGRIDEADRAADRALELWPKHPGVWFGRLWTLAFTGRPGRALEHLEDAAARPAFPDWMVDTLRISLIALEGRRPADVAQAVERLLGDLPRGPSQVVNALLMLNGLGELDRAFEVAHAYFLEEGSLAASVRWRVGQVLVNDQRRRKTNTIFTPVAASMRADPRFLELMRRVGLVDYWRQAGVTPDFLKGAGAA